MISKIGVLIRSKESGQQIGVIEFDASGILICQAIKPDLHVNNLRLVTNLLKENGFRPLYKKYEALKDEKGNLPEEILRSEAEACAKLINEAELKIAGIPVNASVVEWQVADEEPK